MFGMMQKRGARRAPTKMTKLYSIAAVMRGRNFVGRFEVGGVSYEFTYSPAQADFTAVNPPKGGHARRQSLHSTTLTTAGRVDDLRLRLTGSLTVIDTRPGTQQARRSVADVQAALISAQGGIGTAPPRSKLPADLAPERPDLPVVESTGALSFCGVMYFKFIPLDARALGVPADMSAVQLNVRLAPVNEQERILQGVYSSLVDACMVKEVDSRRAGDHVDELNKLLSAG